MVYSPQPDRGNGETHFTFVEELCVSGYLREGQVLVLDNSTIHSAKKYREQMAELTERYKFSTLYLPTYSPELNPCELCFAFIKRQISARSFGVFANEDAFHISLLVAVRLTSPEMVHSFYRHCIWSPFSDRNQLCRTTVRCLMAYRKIDMHSLPDHLWSEICSWLNSKFTGKRKYANFMEMTALQDLLASFEFE